MNGLQAERVNSRPQKIYLTVTGGGTGWAGDFLKHSGGSATLVGFNVPYATEMTDDFIGGKPREKYVSDSTARQLAVASYEKALIAVDDIYNAIGIGVTCSLAHEDQREGRLNHGYLAVQTATRTDTIYFNFKDHVTVRSMQDWCVKRLIDKVILSKLNIVVGEGAFNTTFFNKCIEYTHSLPDHNAEGLEVHIPLLFSHTGNDLTISDGDITGLIFPGSFNPVHDGHLAMAKKAEELLGIKPTFEISIRNFNKPPLDIKEMTLRYRAIKKLGYPVILTTAPMMADKVRLPSLNADTIFMMGVDTHNRISEKDKATFIRPEHDDVGRLLVFPRKGSNIKYKTDVHRKSLELLDFDMDISSTQIRKKS